MPLEILARELGEFAGRLERELRQTMAAAVESLKREEAELRLAVANLREEARETVARRLADVRDGRDGEPGPEGPPGLRGDPGPAGKLPLVVEWAKGVSYEGDVVMWKGETWQAYRDTGCEPSIIEGNDDWTRLTARGQDGRGFSVRGTYVADETYRALDIVALNGGSFAALTDEPGACPGPGWQLLTSPGKRGEKGLPGDRGERGAVGGDGPAIVGGRFDAREMKLVLVREDGATVDVDAYEFARAVRDA